MYEINIHTLSRGMASHVDVPLNCTAGRGEDVRDGRLPLSRQQHTLLQLSVDVLHRTQQAGEETSDCDASRVEDEELLPSAKRRRVRFGCLLSINSKPDTGMSIALEEPAFGH